MHKFCFTRPLVAGFALLLFLVIPGAARAASTTVPASQCQPMMNGAGKNFLHLNHYGALNTSDAAFHIMCPVPRTTTNGVSVMVLGAVTGGASLSCTLHSNVSDGFVMSLKSFTVVGNSAGGSFTAFIRYLSMDADEAPSGSFQMVSCYLPPNAKGRIRGLTVVG